LNTLDFDALYRLLRRGLEARALVLPLTVRFLPEFDV
jgi:hypothetical protein